MELPKWKIEELRARYELEPSIDDIFVEGEFDKRVVHKCLRESGDNRPVYTIDTVDITDKKLEDLGLTSGNKQRVIALSAELNLPDDTKVCLLIDKDYDHFLDIEYRFNGMRVTEGCDLISIMLNKEFVHEIVVDAARTSINDFEVFFCSLIRFLNQISATRITARTGSCPLALIDIVRCASLDSECVVLDVDDYLTRCFSASVGRDDLLEIRRRQTEWFEKISQYDPINTIRSHDFISALVWSIRKLGGSKKFSSPEVLAGIAILMSPKFHKEILRPLQ